MIVICTPVPERCPGTHKLLRDHCYKRSQSPTEPISSLLPHALSFPPPQFPLHNPVLPWKDCSLHAPLPLTHVQRDRDDVQGHGGVCDAAEGRGL